MCGSCVLLFLMSADEHADMNSLAQVERGGVQLSKQTSSNYIYCCASFRYQVTLYDIYILYQFLNQAQNVHHSSNLEMIEE